MLRTFRQSVGRIASKIRSYRRGRDGRHTACACYFIIMSASVEILNIPIGSVLTSTIARSEEESKNDFDVLLLFSENVNLTQSGVSVSAGSSIIAFEGKNSVYKVTIRPPQTSGIVTVTVNRNAVSQGNPQTTKDIRVSTSFPDVDAESFTLKTQFQDAPTGGIAVSSESIFLLGVDTSGGDPPYTSYTYVNEYSHNGVLKKTIGNSPSDIPYQSFLSCLHYINGALIIGNPQNGGGAILKNSVADVPEVRSIYQSQTRGITHTPRGILVLKNSVFQLLPFSENASDIVTLTKENFTGTGYGVVYDQGYIYYWTGSKYSVLELVDDNKIRWIQDLNIDKGSIINDISYYMDHLYGCRRNGSLAEIYTVDIRKYRPLAKNTKSTIYPVFADEGDTIDLKQFSPDAERIVFDVGYDKQPQLSINTSNKLVVGSGAQTCLVKLKAINRIGATETDSFGFYLIVRQAAAPVWRNALALTMRAGSSYDLFQLVPDADAISFRSGRTRLAGSSLSNGVFTIETVGGVSHFTAQKGGRSSHIAITIDVVQGMGSNSAEVVGYRIEIAGIDVTSDSVAFPSVSETLDPVVINEYRVNEASITLRNTDGKYNSDLAGNFWETHGLNAGGFQNAVKIYLKYLDGSENLHFSGVINESFVPIKGATIKLNCSDISSRLRKALVESFGTLEKWDALRKQSDEDSYVGVYVPDPGLGQMQVGTGIARSDRTELEISRLALPSEGLAPENTGYMTTTEFRTAGGFLEERPLLRFMGEHLSEDVRFLINQLAINKEVYNTEIDIPGVEVEDPFLLNRGSVAFSVEPTRTTRLPVDWVQGVESGLQTPPTLLILLSNPEAHIADLLVQYDLSSDSYRVLHTFDKGAAVHRIERRNATNYYILTSGKIAQDRSASELPLQTDATGYAYDSVAEGSEIKIYHYSTSTGTLTEPVAEDDNFSPQLGIHYHVGFENGLYIDEFEGIVPSPYSAFKVSGSNLYYRYAKDEEFGVASIGVTNPSHSTKMIGQTPLNYHNHLNFAFDITSGGAIYFVSAEGDAETSTLTIKRRTRGGTESTIFTETRGIGAFSELGFDFGAFLGCYEALFHNNQLYMLCPIQKADLGDDTKSVINPDVDIEQRSAEKSGERNVTTSTNLNPSNQIVAPGEDIPLRIDFDGSVSGATQDDLTVYGGRIQSFSISSDMIDVMIRPDSRTHHKNIVIDLAEDAVDQGNERWRITIDFETQRSRQKAAGMALYKCDVSAANPSLTVIEKWDFVTRGGCGLTVHAGAVHYVEHAPAATKFKPINPDLDGYWADEEQTQTMGYNIVEESLGALKKISNSDEVENLGNVWFTDRPYNVFPTRMLSIGDDLHLSAGYGNLDELLRYNSLASQADNMVHIVYGKTLPYVLPKFSPTESVYAALADLAKRVNATLSFEKNVIMISDRRPFRAVTDRATGTGTADISFSDANKTFPSSGYLLTGKEILSYTGITGGAFTGIERGVLGSQIANHPDDSEVLYLDTLIQTEKLGSPYKSVVLQFDVNRIFNIIRDSGGVAEVRDEASIALYGERPYTLDLGLTRHEKVWIEEIFKSYLKELSTLQQIVNIQVIPDFSLRLGQIVPFFYKGLISGMRIVSVRYERRTTHIKGRTV